MMTFSFCLFPVDCSMCLSLCYDGPVCLSLCVTVFLSSSLQFMSSIILHPPNQPVFPTVCGLPSPNNLCPHVYLWSPKSLCSHAPPTALYPPQKPCLYVLLSLRVLGVYERGGGEREERDRDREEERRERQRQRAHEHESETSRLGSASLVLASRWH